MAEVTFPEDLGGDGLTVTDDANPDTGLAAGGHRLRFVPALNNTVAMARTATDKAALARQFADQTAADRAQTGQDRDAIAGAKSATAADRVQTGKDAAAASASKTAAASSASAAKTSETNAAASESAAKSSESGAVTAKQSATNAASAAAGSASAAKDSETAAANSASSASSSKTAAANSASSASSSKSAAANSAAAAANSAAQMNASDIMHRRESGLPNEVGAAATANSLDEIPVGSASIVCQRIKAWSLGSYGAYFSGSSENSADVLVAGDQALIASGYDKGTPMVNGVGFWFIVTQLQYNNGALMQLAFSYGNDETSPGNGHFAMRVKRKEWGPWSVFYGTGNTSLGSNGEIRKASPIFRLANSHESAMGDGFTQAGVGAANREAEGVTAVHVDTGVYEVRGSLGFAANDSWPNGFLVPQDANGNNLVFVEAETANDGTITFRTFSRRFDFDKVEIVAGDPIDMPDDRFIAMRLQMEVGNKPAPTDPDS